MIHRFGKLMAWWPVEKAIYAACVIGLVALGIMAAGVLLATPLAVIASMSVAQGFGVLAGVMFAISVAAEAARKR